jgi:hypothetical protein
MNSYEEKKAARIERYEARAAAARAEGERRYKAARAIGDMIPFGQPILVGHHSEKRHRSDINKIDRHHRASYEASKKAEHYEAKAAAAASNTAISSDDPEAIVKLREKLAGLKARHEGMKAVNAAYRKFKKNPASIEGSGLSESQIATVKAFEPQYSWEKAPYYGYHLTNSNANIKRVEKRLEQLESEREAVDKKVDHGFLVYREDVEDNRVRLIFDGKPVSAIRAIVKSHGFRWSPYNSAWQRQLNAAGRFHAAEAIKAIGELKGGE